MEEKKLTVDFIEEVADQYDQEEEITINIYTKNGIEEANVMINKQFSPYKIKSCVREFMSKLDMLKKYTKDFNDIEELIQSWYMMLLIKYFSSLDIPNDFKKQIAILEKMIDTTILFQIFSHFEPKEVEKAMLHLNHATQNILLNIEKNSKEIEKLNEADKLSKEKIKQIIEEKGM